MRTAGSRLAALRLRAHVAAMRAERDRRETGITPAADEVVAGLAGLATFFVLLLLWSA